MDLFEHFAVPARRDRRLRPLRLAVDRLAAAGTLGDRLAALVALVSWVKVRDAAVPAPGDGTLVADPAWRRLAVLVALLERSPELRALVSTVLRAVLADTAALSLFAEAGLPNDRGILDETADRVSRRLLPKPRDEHELSRLLPRMFVAPSDAVWIESIPPDLFASFVGNLRMPAASPADGQAARTDVGPCGVLLDPCGEALCLLAARVQALGLSEALRCRRPPEPLRQSPYFQLPRATDGLLESLAGPDGVAAERRWRAIVDACRAGLDQVHERLETSGVSVDIVYSVDVISRSLDRMEALLAVVGAAPGVEQAAASHRLLVLLVRAKLADRSLRDLAGENLRLLAQKIIERAGRTGEHYITVTRREWAGMLVSAAGGGALTTATAALKVLISGAHFPMFVEGFISGCNYSLSFIVMQLCGMTLATKQPSMTAATLAGVLRGGAGPERIEHLATHVARIVRSQLAAAFANVSVVTVCALGLDLLWRTRKGGTFLTLEKADVVLGSFDPLRTGTFFFACLTGVILWMSSLAAGWVDNFVAYHRLPQAIAEHGLSHAVGSRFMAAVSRFFTKHVSGIGGSIALGFMLGLTPMVGKGFGLPIDVRHVTLSTGQLALAAGAIGRGVLYDPRLYWAVAGIAVIFVCNLGVSFMLALAVAMRARDVRRRERGLLVRALMRRLRTSPGEFVFPPKVESHPVPAPASH